MKMGCAVCNYKGQLTNIDYMSAYATKYACPKCGVVQINTYPQPKEKKEIIIESRTCNQNSKSE